MYTYSNFFGTGTSFLALFNTFTYKNRPLHPTKRLKWNYKCYRGWKWFVVMFQVSFVLAILSTIMFLTLDLAAYITKDENVDE